MGRPGALLALVIATGAALRFWALGSGVPFAVGIDEPAIMTTVVRILKSGDFNPYFFEYPTGYIYAQLGVAILRFLLGTMQTLYYSVEQVGPGDFYLWGRALTALLGTGTVLLVYRAGLRWGERPALLSAALLAVFPMHVRESHFVLTDVPMTFAVVLTLVLSFRGVERQTLSSFAWAGAAAGLAAGIKYNGLFAVVMPLAAAFSTGAPPASVAVRVLAVAGACVGAFVLTTPYSLLDLPAFLNGFGVQAKAFRPRPRSAELSWVLYAKHLLIAFGWPGFVLAVAGGAWSVWRLVKGPGRRHHVVMWAFVLGFGWIISGKNLLFGRYVIPLVPVFCLWAGLAVASGLSLVRRDKVPAMVRNVVAAVLIAAAVGPPFVSSFSFARAFGVKSTQALAWDWISRNVMSGSRVVSEAKGLDLPSERYALETAASLAGRDPAALATGGVEAVILSSDAWGGSPTPPDAYRPLVEAAARVRTFNPEPGQPGPRIQVLILRR